MKLFILIILGVMLSAIIGALCYLLIEKIKRNYIKNSSFLLMINSGEDPCEKNQAISVQHRYIQLHSWLDEV